MNTTTHPDPQITPETLLIIPTTTPTPTDHSRALHIPLTYPKRPWDIGTLGCSYAFRHSARHFQAHHALKAASWYALGLSAWILVSHGLFVLTAPLALGYDAFNKGSTSPRSAAAVRVDVVARALMAAREVLRGLCGEAIALSQPGGWGKEEARRWVAEWRVAVEGVERWVLGSGEVKVKYSYMLHAQLRHTKKVLESCEGVVRAWEDPFALAAQRVPGGETFWVRVDFVPERFRAWKRLRG